MNWQEVDVYVALPGALYLYDAKTHTLVPVVGKDLREATGKQTFVKDTPLNLVYVVDLDRMKNASEDDKRLYSGADVGFIAQNVYLYCASQGLAVVVRGSIDRTVLSQSMELRSEQKIILAQTVGCPQDQVQEQLFLSSKTAKLELISWMCSMPTRAFGPAGGSNSDSPDRVGLGHSLTCKNAEFTRRASPKFL